MHQDNLEHIRAIAHRLAERMRVDPAFKDLVASDPHVLLAEGLPELAIADFLQSTDLLDVSGYLGCSSISAI